MTKNILFYSMFLTTLAVQANEEFTPQQFKLSYTIHAAKNADREAFKQVIGDMHRLINSAQQPQTHRGVVTNFYQQLINFIQNAQQTIASSLGLISSVTTSQESVGQVAEQIAVQAIVANEATVESNVTAAADTIINDATGSTTNSALDSIVNNEINNVITSIANNSQDTATTTSATTTSAVSPAQADTSIADTSITDTSIADTTTTKDVADDATSDDNAVSNNFLFDDASITTINIEISCTITNPADLENWILAIAMLQDLADSINNQTIVADEAAIALDEIAQLLPSNISITLSNEA